MQYTISKPEKPITGNITLEGSKSISNRVLIIRALSGKDFPIKNPSGAKDTATLNRILEQSTGTLDAGPAGTTFRFMTAFLALQNGTQTLTGSERMKQRPIGLLVEALNQLGANISYLEKEGYPPLKIKSPKGLGKNNKISIPANVSSQFISALLMIGPSLPNGLELTLEGKIVSLPYIQMTLSIMNTFGVRGRWEGQTIVVPPKSYRPGAFLVEADWSAASYYYEIVAFSQTADLQLNGLFEDSLQGDAILTEMMEHFGVETTFNKAGIHLKKTQGIGNLFEWNFLECPDLAQTIAATCAGTGTFGTFRGLETLLIKETDRVAALKAELAKTDVEFKQLPESWELPKGDPAYSCNGQAKLQDASYPIFDTYHDHRMAMALAPLSIPLGKVIVKDPMVVEKSYPNYWYDLQSIGFKIDRLA